MLLTLLLALSPTTQVRSLAEETQPGNAGQKG